MFSDLQEDINFSGYKKHLTSSSAPAPLTFAEQELKLIKQNDVTYLNLIFICFNILLDIMILVNEA